MPIVMAHGGRCCGIRHIYGFYPLYDANRDRYLRELDSCIKAVPANRLMEVTLTDGQLKKWWPHLKERGFRQVTRFRNSNSGNYVTVLHFIRKAAPLKEESPYPTFMDKARDALGRFISPNKAKG